MPANIRSELFKSQKTNDGKLTNYGVGWASRTTEDNIKILDHTGGAMGGQGVLRIYPEKKVVIAYLINNDGDLPRRDVATKIALPFLK